MDRKAIRLAVGFDRRSGELVSSEWLGWELSSGIIEKNVDRPHPSFLEYRTVSSPRDLVVIGYDDRAGNVKGDPGPLPE